MPYYYWSIGHDCVAAALLHDLPTRKQVLLFIVHVWGIVCMCQILCVCLGYCVYIWDIVCICGILCVFV